MSDAVSCASNAPKTHCRKRRGGDGHEKCDQHGNAVRIIPPSTRLWEEAIVLIDQPDGSVRKELLECHSGKGMSLFRQFQPAMLREISEVSIPGD